MAKLASASKPASIVPAKWSKFRPTGVRMRGESTEGWADLELEIIASTIAMPPSLSRELKQELREIPKR